MSFSRAQVFTAVASFALVACGGPDPTSSPGEVGSESQAVLAPGSLDPTFGNGGKVVTALNPNGVQNATLQRDGKLVVVAALSDFNIASLVFGVLRYLPNGTLDRTFGGGGVVRTAPTIGFNYPNSVLVAPDGRILVAGSASSPNNSTDQIAVARYRANGSLDPTFGANGIVLTALLGFRDVANVLLLQPDGKILIGGVALSCFGRRCPNNTALVRYNGDGSLDAGFGQGGSAVVNAIGEVNVLALEGDGSILALNRNGIGTNPVARFSANGTMIAVGLSGTLAPVGNGVFAASSFQPDGKIVLGGGGPGLGLHGHNVHVTRWTLGDALDPSFNSPVFSFGPPLFNVSNSVQALLVESNGKIVVGGIAPLDQSTSAFGVARINGDGSLDKSFGRGGIVTTEFTGRADQVTALAAQPDGKIIAVGLTATDNMGGTGIAIARYVGP